MTATRRTVAGWRHRRWRIGCEQKREVGERGGQGRGLGEVVVPRCRLWTSSALAVVPRSSWRRRGQRSEGAPLRWFGPSIIMELLLRVACAEGGAQSGVRSTKAEEALTPEQGEQFQGAPPGRVLGHEQAGLCDRAGPHSVTDGVRERSLLSAQLQERSPVFGPGTPDEDRDDENGAVSPLSIDAATSTRAASTSLPVGGQMHSRPHNSTPPLHEQHAVQLRRESLASEQPEHKCCMGCSSVFSKMPSATVVLRPRPSFCEHAFCSECYAAAVATRQLDRVLLHWPCPACERLVALPVPADSLGQLGPGVVSAPRRMHPWPTGGPAQLSMMGGGVWGSNVGMMPAVDRPNDLHCNNLTFLQRPVAPTSVRAAALDEDWVACSPDGKPLKKPVRPAAPIEGAICKRTTKTGGKGSGKRSVWACAQPGCDYIAHSSRHMLRHMTTHSGERPFECKWPGCGYRAKQREHLKTHELKHTNLKSFKCDVCDFATKRKEHLKRHMQRHVSDRAVGVL